MNRRKFIASSALASGALLIPKFLKSFDRNYSYGPGDKKKLIVIQLSGGNDGLNTVVPFRQDNYYKLRPTLGIKQSDLLLLSDDTGLHNALVSIKKLFDAGEICIINNVGYPDPDFSHFRSMDIWQTASGSEQLISTGWIGRYLDNLNPQTFSPHLAIEFDDTLSLALKGEKNNGFATRNLRQLNIIPHKEFLKAAVTEFHDHNNETNSYLYKTLSETFSSAEYIMEKHGSGKTAGDYPDTEFGKDLKNVASLLNAGSETTVYYVSLSGFDTHVNQVNQQQRFLKTFDESLGIFVNDLKSNNKFDDVLIMVFSEFGRRVAQNANNGTDHGSANNLFLISGALKKKGLYNSIANLSDLDNGNLKYTVDFRDIYANILEGWLQSDPQKIIGRRNSQLNFI